MRHKRQIDIAMHTLVLASFITFCSLCRRVEPASFHRFDLFNPIIDCPTGKLLRIGASGEGGKWLCLEELQRHSECIVYSVGSFGNFDFEEAILRETNCSVHTFDCNSEAHTIIGGRHEFHPIW